MQNIGVRRGDVLIFSWAGDPDKSAVLAALSKAKITDAQQIEVFGADTIAAMGLSTYLVEGYGVDPDDLTHDTARLDGLAGTVVVVSARAFEGNAVLTPDTGLMLIGRFKEAGAPLTAPKPIETESAMGTLAAPAKAPKSDARIGGMVALAVLLFLAVFVFVFVWSAG